MNAYKAAPAEAEELLRELVAQHHKHLRNSKIDIIFYRDEIKKSHKVIAGRASVVTGRNAYYASHVGMNPDTGQVYAPQRYVEPDPFFLIEIWDIAWTAFNKKQRRALMDHELCHCMTKVDDDLNVIPFIVGHDIEEFDAVVKRYGAWHSDLETFLREARSGQPSLELVEAS